MTEDSRAKLIAAAEARAHTQAACERLTEAAIVLATARLNGQARELMAEANGTCQRIKQLITAMIERIP